MQANLHRVGIGVTAPALRNNPRAPVPAAAAGQIKVLTDLVLLFPEDSIDIQVLTDLEFILLILAILLQTLRRSTTEDLTTFAKNDMILTQDKQDASKVRKDLNVYRTACTTRSKGP